MLAPDDTTAARAADASTFRRRRRFLLQGFKTKPFLGRPHEAPCCQQDFSETIASTPGCSVRSTARQECVLENRAATMAGESPKPRSGTWRSSKSEIAGARKSRSAKVRLIGRNGASAPRSPLPRATFAALGQWNSSHEAGVSQAVQIKSGDPNAHGIHPPHQHPAP
jgi:hypothetical protein